MMMIFNVSQRSHGKLTFFSLHVAVYVCSFNEEVFYEGLGDRAEVDVYPAPVAPTLQR